MTDGKFIDFDNLAQDIQELIRASIEVRKMSYSPYSKFKVGAALRCDDGTISCGCNVENSSFPVSICAERTAMARAIADGKRKFLAISIAADTIDGVITSPCGMCRQFLAEFNDIPIYLTSPTMTKILQTSVADLLPLSFKLGSHIST
ncbi:hypothetical protein PV325_005142 [Microctonus aethiopoides]|uniref:Cytidine deaminase n=1 Tax=Microctonus aethiopoides TaxID=144406 RepID=A0AA39FKR5_9HYME|nr:hypothetical protein PV325_005142 [Microctonus aethiopoides]KAK0099097.1 hypothetical protein PV326_006561 [Microctonus aethiopoides]KAK0171333.1 hypothetical protein PV328_009078 [Microctonus aethiopoides]